MKEIIKKIVEIVFIFGWIFLGGWFYISFDTWLIFILIPINLCLAIIFGYCKKKVWLLIAVILACLYLGFLFFWPNDECGVKLVGIKGEITPICDCSIVSWYHEDRFKCYKF